MNSILMNNAINIHQKTKYHQNYVCQMELNAQLNYNYAAVIKSLMDALNIKDKMDNV